MREIGFIGTGIMGAAMAGHLMDAGYSLRVYNRSKEKAQPLIERGAQWRETPADCARDADACITIIGTPRDVETVYLGRDASD
jgi:3-hydroxyisobutyrate dehydrogenase-like beta-hydroxyacid dehydrogenase